MTADDAGLSLWRLLDNAASDDESVELDRLCRMLHAINFFRQSDAADADLYLNVHSRLLSAVSSNHGYAFRRILDALGLPLERIVLQLPVVSLNQRWLLGHVTGNYKRNGFRMALHLDAPAVAGETIEQVVPAAIKLHVQCVGDDAALGELLAIARDRHVQLIVTGVDTAPVLARLEQVAKAGGLPLYAQGGDWRIAPKPEPVAHHGADVVVLSGWQQPV